MNKTIVKGAMVGLAVFALQATAATKTVVLQDGLNNYSGITDMFWANSDGVNRGYPAEGQYNAATFNQLWLNGSG